MTYELAEEILPFCKNCVEEGEVRMKNTQVNDQKKIDELFDISFTDSNLIYKKVCLFSLRLTISNNIFKQIIYNYTTKPRLLSTLNIEKYGYFTF